MTAIAMELKDVEKSFGSVIALSHVSVKVREGAVTCILGDNGAGKSTLIKVLSGVHKPTSGVYEVRGEPVSFDSPRDALANGIATVYQDLATIPLMSVWRNFFLGNENQPLNINGATHVFSSIIPCIVSSAGEAEYAALFAGAQQADSRVG